MCSSVVWIDCDGFIGVFGGGFGEVDGGGVICGGSGFVKELSGDDEVAFSGVDWFVTVAEFVEERLGDV